MRLAQIGAFPFPFPQGSQVYFAEQARSLTAAGAHVTLVCYGSGRGEAPRDFTMVRSRIAPRALGSGPSLAKPVADASLAAALVAAHRREPFDAVLAHNAEGAIAALCARPWLHRPIVYVAHTVLAHELATYAAPRWSAPLSAVGASIDAFVARHVDAVVALSRAGGAALAASARGPVVRIPPGLTPSPAPAVDVIADACRRHGFAPGGFALYAGNLDGYQELGTLAAAAAITQVPIVVATHGNAYAPAPLVTVHAKDAEEVRLLTHGAVATLLARRAAGGFPIKLLNYMDARRAIVARAGVADSLVHDRSGWLLADDAPAAAWAAAVDALAADPAHATQLGAEARRTLEREHDPAALAARTLALVADLAGV